MLYVVGIGPGDARYFTAQAREALSRAEVLCGYTAYIDLVRDIFPDKEFFTTPMTREIERCRKALELSQSGREVAMVCSGDAGVYGMAGPLYELLPEYPGAEIEVVPGVTAALSGAAVLGAPLTHDFCVVSLSDLMTPWPLIEKRLRCAAEGDFAIAIYNPSSRKRADYLQKACDILLEALPADTVCGWVENIGREGETSRVLTLGELREEKLNMFTTVFVGNSATKNILGAMVTPRGYAIGERRERE